LVFYLGSYRASDFVLLLLPAETNTTKPTRLGSKLHIIHIAPFALPVYNYFTSVYGQIFSRLVRAFCAGGIA